MDDPENFLEDKMDEKKVFRIVLIVLVACFLCAVAVALWVWLRPVSVQQSTANVVAKEPTLDPLIGQLATNVAELQKKESVPQNIATPVVPSAPTPVVQNVPQPQGCPQAADLGPWAPVDGVGETFEVTCNELVCSGTHVQLWWPAGSNQPWGTLEISVFVPAGLSVEVQRGAGRGWEYALACSIGEIQRQIDADNTRRKTDTGFFGQVNINDLINTGLVTVRFDRRGDINPTH